MTNILQSRFELAAIKLCLCMSLSAETILCDTAIVFVNRKRLSLYSLLAVALYDGMILLMMDGHAMRLRLSVAEAIVYVGVCSWKVSRQKAGFHWVFNFLEKSSAPQLGLSVTGLVCHWTGDTGERLCRYDLMNLGSICCSTSLITFVALSH